MPQAAFGKKVEGGRFFQVSNAWATRSKAGFALSGGLGTNIIFHVYDFGLEETSTPAGLP